MSHQAFKISHLNSANFQIRFFIFLAPFKHSRYFLLFGDNKIVTASSFGRELRICLDFQGLHALQQWFKIFVFLCLFAFNPKCVMWLVI